MTLGGMLRGAGILLFIVVLAGIIAYIGDRVGHQVGRKRLTLFNIRPRYTSTIIAVGTGMLIAFVVTLAAIFASAQVQTAFFHLNEINAEISKAEARAKALEAKYANARVVVNVDALMSLQVGNIPVNAPLQLRKDILKQFYEQTVASVNQQYTRPPFDLKKFVPPPDVNQILDGIADDPKMQAYVTQNNVLLLATAGQNLYRNDQIHFAITSIPDILIAPAGQAIASVKIPAGKNANAVVALAELLGTTGYVPQEMISHGVLPVFAGNVTVQRMLPAQGEMQKLLSTPGATYILTAFAAQDIYMHTFGVPVVVTLQRLPAS